MLPGRLALGGEYACKWIARFGLRRAGDLRFRGHASTMLDSSRSCGANRVQKKDRIAGYCWACDSREKGEGLDMLGKRGQ